ncbi:MAG: M1 family metallopeptidase [Bacteroidales bacterium]|nr:M1 family metallopeptidase [Bacteroidales bacterium]
MKKYILVSALLAVSIPALAQNDTLLLEDSFSPTHSNNCASYNITAKLDAEAKVVSGTEIITWKNTSNDTINELMFHTYLNAFKNTQSTFFQESLAEGEISINEIGESDWGYIDIQRMVIVDGDPLLQDLKYVQPDDKNTADQTVMSVALPNPILPGQEIKLLVNFLSKLPRIITRTGFERGDFYMVGQWFPKIGVYEPAGMRGRKEGGWNCHQFHAHSEFYSDFGNYDVTITVPESFKVASTGVLQKEFTDTEGFRTFIYQANDIIDFAWSASPRFLVMNDTWKGKGIKLYYMPEHGGQAERYVQAVKNAMEYMESNVGEYVYPQITMVDVPYYAEKSAGMEYPMFFTVSTFRHMPSGIKSPEQYTIHEFVHNYFQAVVATNEFEEAWLDEGFTSFYECEIMDKYYGSYFNMFGYKVDDSEMMRTLYTQWSNPAISIVDNYCWKYPTHTYEMLSYSKPMVMLKSLKGLMGEENFKLAIQNYYRKWKFNHPCGQDLLNCVNNVAQNNSKNDELKDYTWFFNSLLRTDEVCDYKLTSIKNTLVEGGIQGFFDNGITKIFQKGEQTEKQYKSSVFVQRMGTMVVPIEVLVTLENGDTQKFNWDGRGRCKEFVINGNQKVISAQIDPENKIYCDIDLVNNSYSLEANTSPAWKYATKFLFWVENLFQTIAFLA